MGNFNAKIAHGNSNNPNIGRFGLGQRKSRGDTLINYCRNGNLYCLNSLFKEEMDLEKPEWNHEK